jgi:hypothetical protein
MDNFATKSRLQYGSMVTSCGNGRDIVGVEHLRWLASL